MQWRNAREKELGVELGFIVRGEGHARSVRVTNLVFDPKDTDHNSPLQGNVRPASNAEVKMWKMLLNANTGG